MKKHYALLLAALLAPALTACGKQYDYSAHISEARRDIFRAETEEFTVELFCISREYPYASDGVACPMTDVVEISLTPAQPSDADYSVYVLGEDPWGGETAFRNMYGDRFLSKSVESFPQGSVSLKVEWGEETREVTATSVKNEATLSVEEALSSAVQAEKEKVEAQFEGGTFRGEFYVRLLRRDKNYYYVGIIDEGGCLSLLLDAETGEVLARREGKR